MSGKNKKILIVDDEKDIVETLRFILEAEGFSCLTAYDGEEALTKTKAELPDLLILDVMLPKINGYKVCRLLKFDAKYKDIPILMVTARSQEEDKSIGEETGADEYITKPFNIEDVVSLVKQYLAKNNISGKTSSDSLV
jgi:DNA-binding response OmpR family regulator